MSGPLRLLQYITPSGIGGAEVHVLTLAEKLRERGHEVLVLCPHGRPLVGELKARGLPARAPRTTGKVDPIMLTRLIRWFRGEGWQVVHTHLSTASLLGSLAARVAGIPAVATVHGLNTRTCFAWASALVAVSNAVKQHLVGQGVPPDTITVIHNGVDLKLLSRAYHRTELRRQWGVPEEAPLLVTVGRLAPEKGHRDLLQALHLLASRPEWRELRLLMVGTGARQGPLRAEAEALGLAERVVFAGFQRDVPPFVQAADVFVLPSVREGLSLSALEAMALARPVVACRVGGTPEVVVDGQTGLLVSPAAPAELAEALAHLLHHPDLAQEMGRAGERRVREAFDLEQTVTKLENLYRALLVSNRAASA
jgi:glycosyltransferase involved in cell wall biosynthesis